jgi:hypothetical protein
MIRLHYERLSIADAELNRLIQLLTDSATGRAAAGTRNWRETVQLLSLQVREQDSLVTALVAGSQNVKLDLTGAAGRMKFAHEFIRNLPLDALAQSGASNVTK